MGIPTPQKNERKRSLSLRSRLQVELEVLDLKRKLRKRQEQIIEENSTYMATHPDFPEIVGDFLQAALVPAAEWK